MGLVDVGWEHLRVCYWTVKQADPEKHDSLAQQCANAGPASATLAQHWHNVEQKCQDFWVTAAIVSKLGFLLPLGLGVGAPEHDRGQCWLNSRPSPSGSPFNPGSPRDQTGPQYNLRAGAESGDIKIIFGDRAVPAATRVRRNGRPGTHSGRTDRRAVTGLAGAVFGLECLVKKGTNPRPRWSAEQHPG